MAGPALHRFLFGDGVNDEVITFEPDEPVHIIFGGEAVIALLFMFLDARDEVTGHAVVKRSVFSVTNEVNVTIAHSRRVQEMDYKNKSCNDGIGGFE